MWSGSTEPRTDIETGLVRSDPTRPRPSELPLSWISACNIKIFCSENQTKTVVYVNLGKAVRPEENIWLSITGKKENVRRAREMLQEKLDQFY